MKALLANTGRDPDEVIAVLPLRLGEATIRMLAINAALAGARPEHLQVIIAAIEAVAVPLAGAWEDLMVIVAGGAGKHSAFIPTFGRTRSVTRRIGE